MNTTKAALLDLAEDITQTSSFANVSFQALADGIGIKKGSVYYHFKSKEELGDAIIERAANQLKQGLKDIRHEPILKQLHVYTNWFKKHIGASEKLCPGINFVASWDSVTTSTQQQVLRLYRVHKEGLEAIITDGRNAGEFEQSDLSPADMATCVFAILQGGLITSRITGNVKEFDLCKAAAIKLIKNN